MKTLKFGMECSKVMIATQANIKVKLMKLSSIVLFFSAIMLMTTAILFAVQIRTDFFSNRVVTNIFGSQVGKFQILIILFFIFSTFFRFYLGKILMSFEGYILNTIRNPI